MLDKQICVSIAAGKRNLVSTSTLFTTAQTLPKLPADGTYATETADVTYRRYLRCVVLETRHDTVRHSRLWAIFGLLLDGAVGYRCAGTESSITATSDLQPFRFTSNVSCENESKCAY